MAGPDKSDVRCVGEIAAPDASRDSPRGEGPRPATEVSLNCCQGEGHGGVYKRRPPSIRSVAGGRRRQPWGVNFPLSSHATRCQRRKPTRSDRSVGSGTRLNPFPGRGGVIITRMAGAPAPHRPASAPSFLKAATGQSPWPALLRQPPALAETERLEDGPAVPSGASSARCPFRLGRPARSGLNEGTLSGRPVSFSRGNPARWGRPGVNGTRQASVRCAEGLRPKQVERALIPIFCNAKSIMNARSLHR
jgi:hypothetical protein